MMKNNKINPVGLKGNQINERMKELMGIAPINENKSTSSFELTKMGPDGNAYAIVRENREWYIKKANKSENLVAEDFKYIGGLQNKKMEAYPSYSAALKRLNLKFNSLAEAYNFTGEINIVENDNLLSEAGIAGFSEMKGNGFSGEGNLENNKPMFEIEDIELTETEEAIEAMIAREGIGGHSYTDDMENQTSNDAAYSKAFELMGVEEPSPFDEMNSSDDWVGTQQNAGGVIFNGEQVELGDNEGNISNYGPLDRVEIIYKGEPILVNRKSLKIYESEVKKKSLNSSLEETKFKLKVADPTPDSTPSAEPMPMDDMAGGDMAEPANMDDMGGASDKPFDDEPFDAGVEADEETDPKKFIEQLTGKLGQSLRKYTEEQGQPDFELEKFAINSLLSATHTSEMDAEDQKDIISKVRAAGEGDEEPSPEGDMDMPSDEAPTEEPMSDEVPEEPAGEESLDELVLKEYIDVKKLGRLKTKNIFSRDELKSILDMIYNSVDTSGQYRIGDIYQALGFPWGETTIHEEMGNLFVNPKKNNMFQPGSNDKLNEACWKGYKQVGMKDKNGKQVPNCVPINEEEGLSNSEKFSIFDKMYLKGKLHETFNQDDTMNEPMTKPAPVVTPTEKPVVTPSRKDKPFLPMPEVTPYPKAINENNKKNLGDFKYMVKQALIRLKSGDKILAAIDSGKYDNYLMQTLNAGFDSELIANRLRDHWYGA